MCDASKRIKHIHRHTYTHARFDMFRFFYRIWHRCVVIRAFAKQIYYDLWFKCVCVCVKMRWYAVASCSCRSSQLMLPLFLHFRWKNIHVTHRKKQPTVFISDFSCCSCWRCHRHCRRRHCRRRWVHFTAFLPLDLRDWVRHIFSPSILLVAIEFERKNPVNPKENGIIANENGKIDTLMIWW